MLTNYFEPTCNVRYFKHRTDQQLEFKEIHQKVQLKYRLYHGPLYIRYRSSSQKNKQRSAKLTDLISFANHYQVRQNQTRKFQFCSSSFFFFYSVIHKSKTTRCVKLLCILNYCLLMEIIPTGFELRVSYYWQVMASKLLLRRFTFSFQCFFGFSHNCVGLAHIIRPHSDY